ncbi:MAG: heme-copper oxidase subunit III [Candidatus Eremiobacteraeota bacterium]|nr:heme-copper oxidase subunit III [Candidatus Eremiobacteraeota bacterium]
MHGIVPVNEASISEERLEVRGHALILGVVLFLASELMFFAAWFATYFELRGNSRVWPPPGVRLDLVESSIGTLLLGASSLFVLFALRRIRKRRPLLARAWLAGAIACACAFLALTFHGWTKNGFGIGSHAYGSTYYGLTGFHALHVTAGVIALTYVLVGANKPAFAAADAAGADAIGYYWHFVFAVWFLGIWPLVYFVR